MVHLSEFFIRPFEEWSWILYNMDYPVIHFFDSVSVKELGFEKLLSFYSFESFFYTSICGGFFIRVWMTASLLKSRDSSQYSGRSYQCIKVNGFHSTSYFNALQFLYQSVGDCTKCTNFNGYHCQLHVPKF